MNLTETCLTILAMSAPVSRIARSLSEAFSLRDIATSLLLRGHADVKCVNIMCEQVGRGCACRLALSLSRMRAVQHVDVADNALPTLPASLFELPAIQAIVASNNALSTFPIDAAKSRTLIALDLSGNNIKSVPWEALVTDSGESLRRIVLTGNPLPNSEIERGRALLPRLEIICDRVMTNCEALVSGLASNSVVNADDVRTLAESKGANAHDTTAQLK